MTTFLLIRHGETSATGKTLTGWMPGWPLNSNGKRQAEMLGQRLARLPIRAIYSSPLERALETAEPVARHHALVPHVEPEFGEMRFGAWEGMTMEELSRRDDWKAFNTFRSCVRAPGGELIAETQARMIRRLACVGLHHPDQIVAIVSHGDPLRAALAYYLGIPLDLIFRFEVSPGSVSVAQVADWGVRVLCLNETGDLPL